MIIAIALMPLLAVVLLLATRRVSLLTAGCIGLALALIASVIVRGDTAALPAVLGHALAHGGWIAWQAISVILAGVLLYQVLRHARPDLFEPAPDRERRIDHGWLFAICFLLGPFVEATTGFGVGYLITVSLLLRLGVSALPAVVFGLFSQILVPWGALGIGTVIGAELVSLPVNELGMASALLSVPLLVGYWVTFLWLCRRLDQAPSARETVVDALWLMALLALLWLTHRVLAVEVAVLASAGPLLVLRWWLDGVDRVPLTRIAQTALPYAVLTALLLLTRSVPALEQAMSSVLVIRPSPAWPSFPLLYHASVWLALVAVGYAVWQLPAARIGAVCNAWWRSASSPVLVTLVFMVMADVLAVTGVPTMLADAWVGVSDRFAVIVSPLMAMTAGALTGSNAASNALLINLQVALAEATARDPMWLAAIQNTAGSNATLFSPVRVAMGVALVSMAGREGEIYAQIWPLIGIMLLVTTVASVLA